MIMFHRMISVLIVLLLNLSGVFSSPVLLWSNGNFPSSSISLSNLSPLKLLSQSICQLPFERIQLRLFAINDLTHSQLQRGPSSEHPLLRAAKESNAFRYYPEVSGDVYKTFSLIEQSNQYECSKIQFHLSSSTIYKSLDEALNAMEVSINSLGNNDNAIVVMALIPGPTPFRNEIRLRRAVESTDNILISDDSSCMFYAERLYLGSTNPHDPSSKNYTLDLDNSSCEPTENNSTNSTVTLKLVWLQEHNDADNVEMTFRIEMSGLYWTLERVFFNDSEYRYFAYGMHSLMETPPRFSYACTTATFVKYNPVKYGTYDFKSRFFIKNLQFQPYHANGSYFGPVNYCTSFFTSGIWMGITSSLLCLGILLFGVQRMMAIQPNSRYDDPKGKPLVIKAQE